MGKPKCRAFRLLRYFLLSLCLSPSPSGETRSICFSRDAASTSQVSPLYFREIVDSFLRPFVPNIFTEYLFFPSFFLPFFFFFLPMLRSKHRNLKETEGVELQTRIYVQSLIN